LDPGWAGGGLKRELVLKKRVLSHSRDFICATGVLGYAYDIVSTPTAIDSLHEELRALLGDDNLIASGDSLTTLSRDYYWYSPALKIQLEDKRADLIARPATLDEARAVIAACYKAGVAITPRGAGTGNYGQCVPLYGGVVLDLTRMDRIHSVDGGFVRAEPGARLGVIETVARAAGWELRCYPSTWMKATLGGFFGGGAGGIGGVRWGGIGSGDTVKAITILTCEAEPRTLRYEGPAAMVALRTFGTTGVMVEIEMRLAPKLDYDQLAFSSPDWNKLLAWTDAAARNGTWVKRVVSQFQWPIPSYFKPLKKVVRENEHVGFILPVRGQTAEVLASAAEAGLTCIYNRPLSDPPRPPFLSDFTFNHTTLWAMKADPAFTYVQTGFTGDFCSQFDRLMARFPDELLLHLEWGARDPDRAVGPTASPEAIGVGGIPLIRYTTDERFREILAYAAEIGVTVGTTHTVHLGEGGPEQTAARHILKHDVDPRGLLNPGKMKSFPVNPFAGNPA
jgi:FAD/FMN-containing dehydrogenase